MARPFKSALVTLVALGFLTLAPGSALADGTGATTNTGGASGCCRTID